MIIDNSKCEHLVCGWMCGKVFVDSGIELECNEEKVRTCIKRKDNNDTGNK